MTVIRNFLAGCASPTRALFVGGGGGAVRFNVIDYVTIATTGNATDFGDLTENAAYLAAAASATRGLRFGGFNGPALSTIDYVTIASTGNAIDFGDLAIARLRNTATSSSIRAVNSGGKDNGGTKRDEIDSVEIATLGNATLFGDLTVAREDLGSCSNGHGGI